MAWISTFISFGFICILLGDEGQTLWEEVIYVRISSTGTINIIVTLAYGWNKGRGC